MRITERTLWRYIDGECSPEELEAVEQALRDDERLREHLDRLMGFHRAFQGFFRQRVVGNTQSGSIARQRLGERLNAVAPVVDTDATGWPPYTSLALHPHAALAAEPPRHIDGLAVLAVALAWLAYSFA